MVNTINHGFKVSHSDKYHMRMVMPSTATQVYKYPSGSRELSD